MAVWSQAAEIKIMAGLNLAVALRSVIRHYKHCKRVYQGALPLLLEVLEQSREFTNLQEI